MSGRSVYQISLENGTTALVVAEEPVEETRVWALGIAAGLGKIIDTKRLGPVMATILDKNLVPDLNYSEVVRSCRD